MIAAAVEVFTIPSAFKFSMWKFFVIKLRFDYDLQSVDGD